VSEITASFEHDDVFINCPFDDAYNPLFEAIVFSIFACGFRPRSGLELEDGGQTRIEKLYAIIDDCRFGIHDLSRTELDDANNLPRFSMPFELGLFLGAKRFGDSRQKTKRCLIFDLEPYRYQKFISDLAGMDIRGHSGRPDVALVGVRDWLANVSRRELPAGALIAGSYARFISRKTEIARDLGFDAARVPYVDLERMVTAWLLEDEAPQSPRKMRRPRGKPA
jgi:hypothetical protein